MPEKEGGQSLAEFLLLLSGLLMLSLLALRTAGPGLQKLWTAQSHFFSLPSP